MEDKVSKSELLQRLQDKVSFKDMMHFLKLDDEAVGDAENNIQSVITASSQKMKSQRVGLLEDELSALNEQTEKCFDEPQSLM